MSISSRSSSGLSISPYNNVSSMESDSSPSCEEEFLESDPKFLELNEKLIAWCRESKDPQQQSIRETAALRIKEAFKNDDESIDLSDLPFTALPNLGNIGDFLPNLEGFNVRKIPAREEIYERQPSVTLKAGAKLDFLLKRQQRLQNRG